MDRKRASYMARDGRVDRGLELFPVWHAHRGREHPRYVVLPAVDLHYLGQVSDGVVDVRQQDALDIALDFATLLIGCPNRKHVNAGRGARGGGCLLYTSPSPRD